MANVEFVGGGALDAPQGIIGLQNAVVCLVGGDAHIAPQVINVIDKDKFKNAKFKRAVVGARPYDIDVGFVVNINYIAGGASPSPTRQALGLIKSQTL